MSTHQALKNILVIHGPNLNLLGQREPAIYGSMTLDELNMRLKQRADLHQIAIDFFQSNHEGAIVDRIQAAHHENISHILINPGAFTHTSIAIRDALAGVSIPFIEIHISNIHQRESFRQFSYLSDIAMGSIIGLGWQGYVLGLERLIMLKQPTIDSSRC